MKRKISARKDDPIANEINEINDVKMYLYLLNFFEKNIFLCETTMLDELLAKNI